MQSTRVVTFRFALVWFAGLFDGLAFFLFLHFPGFLQDVGATEVEIGLVIGAAAISSVAIRPWVGREMDTRGRRPMIIGGKVANVIILSLYLTISSLGPGVYVIRILHGAAQGVLFTVLITYAADVVPAARRTQGLALFGVSGLLPLALAGVIGDVVLSIYDFTALFVTALAFGVAALACALPLHETMPPDGSISRGRQGFVSVIRSPNLRPLWFIAGVFGIVLTAYFTFLRTFVNDTSIGSVGIFFAAYAATAIALRLTLGWLPDRVGQRQVLYPAMTMLAIGFLALAQAGSSLDVAIAGVLSGIGHGFGFPILLAMVVTRAREADRGSAVAFFTSEFDLGLLLGGPFLGAIVAARGYGTMFVVCALMTVAAVGVFAVWDRGRKVGPDPATDAASA